MNLEEFKRIMRDRGSHYFEASTMAFFGSKVHTDFIGDGYFITSEWKGLNTRERAFTLRQADFENFRVRTVGQFGEHPTFEHALAASRELIYPILEDDEQYLITYDELRKIKHPILFYVEKNPKAGANPSIWPPNRRTRLLTPEGFCFYTCSDGEYPEVVSCFAQGTEGLLHTVDCMEHYDRRSNNYELRMYRIPWPLEEELC